MHAIDFSPLYRSAIGFDRVNRLLESARRAPEAGGFPPYDIEKLGENGYRISIALAGYGEDELEVTAKENSLEIVGKSKAADQEVGFLHRGIARRSFVRRFELADTVKVVGASLENGLLRVDLVNEVPEAKRPRRIEIQAGAADGPQTIDAAAA